MEVMLQAMMKRFRLFIGMGFMIVAVAVLLGLWSSILAAGYYGVDKATREAAGTGSTLAQTRATIEAVGIWLPYFKFLGLAMILGGITMALGVIAQRLKVVAERVMATLPAGARRPLPPPPPSVMGMRLSMMLGMLLILGGLIFSLTVAGTASLYWNHSIAAQLDPAPAGSALQSQIQYVAWAEGWLEALKFVGAAFLFLGIVQGLKTILTSVGMQRQLLPKLLRGARGEKPSLGQTVA